MELLLGSVFVASLLGSLHCVGMCGPFALLAGSNVNGKSTVGPTLAYSLGRLVSYSTVGAVFGLLGMAINNGTNFANWQQGATYLAGGLMVAVGAIALARHIGFVIPLPKAFLPIQRLLQKGFQSTNGMQPFPRALMIGALTSIMPCGWLYTFAITAAGTGSPVWGAVLMAVFWAGTVPILVALMLGFQKVGASFRQHVPVIMAALVIAVGVFTIAYRAPVSLEMNAKVVSGSRQLVEQVNQIDHETLPCCSDKKNSKLSGIEGSSK